MLLSKKKPYMINPELINVDCSTIDFFQINVNFLALYLFFVLCLCLSIYDVYNFSLHF